jgi:hypothetical protein
MKKIQPMMHHIWHDWIHYSHAPYRKIKP